MQLGSTLGDGVACDLDAFFDRMRVRVLLPCTSIEPTELAIGHADVRVIEVSIDVVIRRYPVLTSANCIGQLAESIEVMGVVESEAVVKREPFTVLDLKGDVAQFFVK